MKKIVLLLCFFTSLFASGQDDNTQPEYEIFQVPQKSFWDHVRFGGGLGLGFGSNSTTINISPSAIYDFENGFAMGIGVGYLYSKVEDFKSNVFSPGIIALYNPAQEIQLSTEFEYLFVNQKFGNLGGNFDYPALYLGVAYRTGWAAFGVRYDVLYDERDSIFTSPFSPIFRIYF
jgi:hypothetical protein